MVSTPKWAHDLVCWQLGVFCRPAAAYSSTLLTIPEIPCIRWTGHVAAPDCRRNTTICRGSQFRRAVLVRSYAWRTGCKTLCRMCRIERSPLLGRTIGTPSRSHLCPDASHHKGLTHRFRQREIKESWRFWWMCNFSGEWASTLVKGLLKRNFLHNLQIPTSSCGWLQLSNMVTSLPQPVHMKDGAASLTLILSSLCIIATLTSHPSPFDRCFSSLTAICMQIFQNLSLKTSENHFAFLLQKSCALKAMESFHLYLPLKNVDTSRTRASLHCYEMLLTFNLVFGWTPASSMHVVTYERIWRVVVQHILISIELLVSFVRRMRDIN